ncbi:MAG: ABC transporter permease [Pirellulales bacterium]
MPDHFLKETGLTLGDSFSLVPPEKPKEAVSYKIVGVVRLLGWHWLTKTTGFRTKTHRAAALVFANYQTVSEDFSLPRASHLWFDYADKAPPDSKALAEQARTAYQQQLNLPVSVGRNANGGASIQLMPVEDIRNATRGAARRWLWIISQIPLLALLITSFGVLNVMLASVRARRWEIGILRSLGFTRARRSCVVYWPKGCSSASLPRF